MPNEIGLWNKTSSESDVATAPALPATDDGVPSKKKASIRWSIFDAMIALGLTIATQVILSIVLVASYLFEHSEDLESVDTDAVVAELTGGPVIVGSSVLMYAAWFLAIWFASRKRGLRSYQKDFWLKFKVKDIWIGALIALGVRVAEVAVTSALDALGANMDGASNATSITDLTGFWWFAAAILIASIAGPFMEEFLFRGLILQSFLRLFRSARPLARHKESESMPYLGSVYRFVNVFNSFFFRWRNVLAALVTSAIFGSMHYQGVDTFGQVFVMLWTGLLGFVLTMVVYRTKRLGPAIVAHVLINFSGVMLTLIG